MKLLWFLIPAILATLTLGRVVDRDDLTKELNHESAEELDHGSAEELDHGSAEELDQEPEGFLNRLISEDYDDESIDFLKELLGGLSPEELEQQKDQFLEKLAESLTSDEVDQQKNLRFGNKDPREDLDVPQLMDYYGYGCEVHQVTTEDGYILTMHRMLPSNLSSATNTGRPVMLQHGLLASASTWIMNYPEKALGYILTDLGYDVWLGNFRGSNYSIAHTTLDTSSYDFWDFSMGEMGTYDLPAMIDYVVESTDYDQIHYVGHSMGTQTFWIMEYYHQGYAITKVLSMSALAPIAYVGQSTSPLRIIAPFTREFNWFLRDLFSYYQFFGPEQPLTKFIEDACDAGKIEDRFCGDVLFFVAGWDENDVDWSWMPVYMKQLAGGASTRTIVHFGQLMHEDNFIDYNYYRRGNKNHYGSKHPPTFDLSKVEVPVLLKWGAKDVLADPNDVARLYAELTGCNATSSAVSNPDFTHLDFVWGMDAYQVVYPDVISFMQEHEPTS